jgi:hypothetical protein
MWRLCSLELINQNQHYFFSHETVFFSQNKSASASTAAAETISRTEPAFAQIKT